MNHKRKRYNKQERNKTNYRVSVSGRKSRSVSDGRIRPVMLKVYERKVTDCPLYQIADPFWCVVYYKTRDATLILRTMRL